MDKDFQTDIEEKLKIQKIFYRYLSFWPYISASIIIFILSGYFYTKYITYEYEVIATIEILDKAQDSEMALPSSMTIFNRSMINLDNEVGVLGSYSLHNRVVKNLDYNVKYFKLGKVKSSEIIKEELFEDFKIDFKIDTDSITKNYVFEIITFQDNNFTITKYLNDEVVDNFEFNGSTTLNSKHNLPFELTFNIFQEDQIRQIRFFSVDQMTIRKKNLISIQPSSSSDQLIIKMNYPNSKLGESYINSLIYEFDRDGIVDRQLEYKRTIDFVDSRSIFLKSELEQIELKKQSFKKENNLSDLQTDASTIVNQQLVYDNELFEKESQRDLIELLKESVLKDGYNYLPVNIGVENNTINSVINDFNQLVKERQTYLVSAGLNNSIVKNIDNELKNINSNILNSIENYSKKLNVQIENLKSKEKEIASFYSKVPENEKVLRSINRELNVKESLFLLLLQKREEAAINYAVVKPSIKIIDLARSSEFPITPNKKNILVTFFLIGFSLPVTLIFIYFSLDKKIHTREQLNELIPNIPVIGEIPHLNQETKESISISSSRDILAESIRMVTANVKLSSLIKDNSSNCPIFLVTSSVKGEGKTLISSNVASILATKDKKVLLIGADLRNPQIHKIIGKSKNQKGLSDIMYYNIDPKEVILKIDNLDILLSGTIPPNPSELLSSESFSQILSSLKKSYDYIVIDSAPCLLVSDTFEISKNVDLTLYVVRSNFSEKNLTSFIADCKRQNKLKNLNLVLNGVGNSQAYGYKYGYQYGYRYGYTYNYGYGYGYGQ